MQYTALYCRVSRDDELSEVSNSVANQHYMLESYAREHNLGQAQVFIDDGFSGTDFNRPNLLKMLDEVNKGYVSTIVVKDLSRFGRDYIRVGYYLEMFFPSHNVRFIAVDDKVDTINPVESIVAFKNVMNELYAKEVSQKVKAIVKHKGNSGIPLGSPPYGYTKNSENPSKWVVDGDTANVIKKIYNLYATGYSIQQIIDKLAAEHIPPPRCKNADSLTEIPHWSKATIAKILSQQEYLGDVINFKTRSVSYKDKTRLKNEPDDQVVFKGVHEPIIDFSLWSKVQDMKATQSNSRKSNRGIRTLFSGILICSDCGAKLNYHFDQKNPDTQYYSCSAYNRSKQECGKSHYIRLDFLTAIVIAELNRAFEYAATCPTEFAHLVQNNHFMENDVANVGVLNELKPLLKRNRELDDIFQRLFESKATCEISDERYEKLSASFQNQQTEIEERIKALQSKLKKVENKEVFPEKFIELANNYGHISELNRETLFSLIDFIEVFSAERSGTTQIQTIKIYYHHVGFFEIPQDIPEVSISSRKGQTLKYLPYNEYICILGSEIK